jgi:hypothetical protein
MAKFTITEEEKDEILGQHKKEASDDSESRRVLDTTLSSMDFTRLKSKGLTPYYFDRDSNNFGIVELNKVVKPSAFNKPKEVFLLTQDEYEKIKKLSDNIKEMVSLKLKQIELYKEYIPAVMQEIIKKNKK